jgi:hypothetical protein
VVFGWPTATIGVSSNRVATMAGHPSQARGLRWRKWSRDVALVFLVALFFLGLQGLLLEFLLAIHAFHDALLVLSFV